MDSGNVVRVRKVQQLGKLACLGKPALLHLRAHRAVDDQIIQAQQRAPKVLIGHSHTRQVGNRQPLRLIKPTQAPRTAPSTVSLAMAGNPSFPQFTAAFQLAHAARASDLSARVRLIEQAHNGRHAFHRHQHVRCRKRYTKLARGVKRLQKRRLHVKRQVLRIRAETPIRMQAKLMSRRNDISLYCVRASLNQGRSASAVHHTVSRAQRSVLAHLPLACQPPAYTPSTPPCAPHAA